MASTPKNAADAAETPLVEEAPIAPESIPEAAPVDEAEASEVDHDAALSELNATPIPMRHPDGGTCDLYKTDKAGNILVPASEAASMIEHGFAVVSGA